MIRRKIGKKKTIYDEINMDTPSLDAYPDNPGTFATSLKLLEDAIIKGLLRNNLQPNIYAVCCTNAVQHCKRLHKEIKENKDLQKINIEILPAEIEYYSECNIETPFPSHPNYDKKAWYWLSKNNIEGETLFWNIGG